MRQISITPSSNVKSVLYDEDEMQLIVQFKKAVYVYRGVPEDVAQGFEGSPSAGDYFNTYVKGQFEFQKAS